MEAAIQVELTENCRSWLDGQKDKSTRLRIAERIRRLSSGLFGQTRALGGGLEELKLDFGPGYRVYFARRGAKLVVVLCGGDKSTQSRDIEKARQLLIEWDSN